MDYFSTWVSPAPPVTRSRSKYDLFLHLPVGPTQTPELRAAASPQRREMEHKLYHNCSCLRPADPQPSSTTSITVTKILLHSHRHPSRERNFLCYICNLHNDHSTKYGKDMGNFCPSRFHLDCVSGFLISNCMWNVLESLTGNELDRFHQLFLDHIGQVASLKLSSMYFFWDKMVCFFMICSEWNKI